jgi:hypothetical protein
MIVNGKNITYICVDIKLTNPNILRLGDLISLLWTKRLLFGLDVDAGSRAAAGVMSACGLSGELGPAVPTPYS